ncbi:unnamed protein product [Cunninghamella blakesleeana]
MQFKLTSLFFFVFALFAVTSYALPSGYATAVTEDAIDKLDTTKASLDLIKRTKYPIKGDKVLAKKLMAEIRANVKANILVAISASVTEQLKGSLKIDLDLLGGLISAKGIKLSFVEKLAINDLKVRIRDELDVNLEAEVYTGLEVELLKLLQKKGKCTEKDILDILIKIEAKLKAQLKIKLPKLCLGLKARLSALLDACVKSIQIKIPSLLSITLSASLKLNVALQACVDLAVKLCADLNVKACASAVLKAVL